VIGLVDGRNGAIRTGTVDIKALIVRRCRGKTLVGRRSSCTTLARSGTDPTEGSIETTILGGFSSSIGATGTAETGTTQTSAGTIAARTGTIEPRTGTIEPRTGTIVHRRRRGMPFQKVMRSFPTRSFFALWWTRRCCCGG